MGRGQAGGERGGGVELDREVALSWAGGAALSWAGGRGEARGVLSCRWWW